MESQKCLLCVNQPARRQAQAQALVIHNQLQSTGVITSIEKQSLKTIDFPILITSVGDQGQYQASAPFAAASRQFFWSALQSYQPAFLLLSAKLLYIGF
jgi:hypothetical protein